jgi:hypothetical protein
MAIKADNKTLRWFDSIPAHLGVHKRRRQQAHRSSRFRCVHVFSCPRSVGRVTDSARQLGARLSHGTRRVKAVSLVSDGASRVVCPVSGMCPGAPVSGSW